MFLRPKRFCGNPIFWFQHNLDRAGCMLDSVNLPTAVGVVVLSNSPQQAIHIPVMPREILEWGRPTPGTRRITPKSSY